MLIHRAISVHNQLVQATSYLTTLPCHGRGREFESRRPRHFYGNYYRKVAPPREHEETTP